MILGQWGERFFGCRSPSVIHISRTANDVMHWTSDSTQYNVKHVKNLTLLVVKKTSMTSLQPRFLMRVYTWIKAFICKLNLAVCVCVYACVSCPCWQEKLSWREHFSSGAETWCVIFKRGSILKKDCRHWNSRAKQIHPLRCPLEAPPPIIMDYSLIAKAPTPWSPPSLSPALWLAGIHLLLPTGWNNAV